MINGGTNPNDRRGFYAFTIKGTGRAYPTFEETLKEIDKIKELFRSKNGEFISEPTFEFDSKHRIHAHATIRSRSFLHSRFKRVGWHLDFRKLNTAEDMKRWINYLLKTPLPYPLCQQYDAELYYQRNNGFLDL